MKRNTTWGLAALAAAGLLACGPAAAALTYGNIAPPGVYFGTGNANGDFTISTGAGGELALRAKDRGTGATIDGSSGVYHANTGLCAGPICTSPRAAWSYEFSVNPMGATGYTYLLGVDNDPTAGVNYTWVNAATYFGDNATMGDAFQNSENIIFGNTPGGPFDIYAPGSYQFALQAFLGNTLANEVSITVQVPEPGSLALLGIALGALAVLLRRRV
jgi:hypothetical protein